MFDEGSAVTVDAATLQLRVEGVEDVGVEAADLEVTDQRSDVVVGVAEVGLAGGAADPQRCLCLVEVALEEPVDRGFGARVPAFLDLGAELVPDCLRSIPGGLALLRGRVLGKRDGLGEVVSAAREWIDARLDAHSE
ncbi:hypothetical protein AB0I28_09570 [Phytomonospora sp. NPDC050363]|uniref:hypothetical protein n=1 Tax=Phytomonospora sp. NPDC050363 TaxID=3155642 RepID=UPI0034086C0D